MAAVAASSHQPARPISATIAALGGQGGGVVTDWLVQVARRERYLVQATSVPGVAQRTGATIYYLEFFPIAALPANRREPIMALMPSPGDVDLVLASELVEAGRSVARGLVSTQRTTLVASTHREYAISEKTSPGDGRADSAAILKSAADSAQRLLTLDMRAVADRTGGHLSAVMLGAIAASGVLPFARDSYLAAIQASGFDVASNVAAFDAAGAALGGLATAAATAAATVLPATPATGGTPPLPAALAARLRSEVPAALQAWVETGVRRMLDYQDQRYAELYLDRLASLPVDVPDTTAREQLPRDFARALALWMSFEDVIRVADLKTRRTRSTRTAAIANAAPGELVKVIEYLKPRAEEVLGLLPARLARRLAGSARARRWLGGLCAGRQISTTTVSGFVLLRCLAILRPWRRGTGRFQEEDQAIRDWIALLQDALRHNVELALELIACQQLVRGYGDTRERGAQAFAAISRIVRQDMHPPVTLSRVRALREAAQADDDGARLQHLFNTSQESSHEARHVH
jgi:indolepyruvate ferredoxin oxidoreductase, beta subunit